MFSGGHRKPVQIARNNSDEGMPGIGTDSEGDNVAVIVGKRHRSRPTADGDAWQPAAYRGPTTLVSVS